MFFLFWTILLAGILPYSYAGNLCQVNYPGLGICMTGRRCPAGYRQERRYSNLMGCRNMNEKCCVKITSNNNGNTNRQFQSNTAYTLPAFNRNTCGIGSLLLASRIFNGVHAGPCDWPFVVSIRSLKNGESRLSYTTTMHRCAGVLVDMKWVLTSAICAVNAAGSISNARNAFIVVAGEYNISGIDIDPLSQRQQEQIISVERVVVHPQYRYNRVTDVRPDEPLSINSNSIALIKLAQPITGHCSGLICLPTRQEADNDCASYDDCVITGWGFIDETLSPAKGSRDRLNQGRVRLSSNRGCDLVTERLNLARSRPQGTICQAPADILTGGCLGDEGGAVMCSNGRNWVVRGIIPFYMCTRNNFNLFVTDVDPYLTWIENTIRAG